MEKEVSPNLYTAHYNALVFGDGLLGFLTTSQTLANDIVQKAGILQFVVLSLILLSWIPLAVWIVVGWGAYRELTSSSRFRSIIALALFIVLLFPVAGLLGLVGLLLPGLFAQETSS
jgi:hypothetical protein